MAYLQLLNDGGVDPLQFHLDGFAVSPPPRDAQFGSPFFPALPDIFRGQAVRKAEPVVDYLVSMGWATLADDFRVQLTSLGRVVLAGLGTEDLDPAQSSAVADVVLEPKDPLAWVSLTRVVGAAGEGLLVDAYFKADFVPWLVDSTTMRRVLISSRHPKAQRDLGLMAIALATVPDAGVLEVRSTDSPELHDRCIITADGDVQLLGSSVTGVGKNFTAIMHPDQEVKRLYRNRYESLWKSAIVVEPRNPSRNAQVTDKTSPETENS
ncbi:hypothetical protein [Amycolatopsis sp. WGS_07]|uniref:hypothetical protein n=1 Tax=Amycolatopsis sp. WGS_07 TaxID=3076764 RepID=UPI0038738F6C